MKMFFYERAEVGSLLVPCAQTLIATFRLKQASLLWRFVACREDCLHHCDRAHKEPLLPRSATFSTYNNIGPQSCSNSTAAFLPRYPKQIQNELHFLILINHPSSQPPGSLTFFFFFFPLTKNSLSPAKIDCCLQLAMCLFM